MASGGEEKKETKDFYAVLGLNKECTASELKDAYKRLALRWHPDRCSASGSSRSVEESKKKFQAIQQAYSVLSDADQRLLYDVGFYNDDDDDENLVSCPYSCALRPTLFPFSVHLHVLSSRALIGSLSLSHLQRPVPSRPFDFFAIGACGGPCTVCFGTPCAHRRASLPSFSGMGEFLSEMAVMMSQTQSGENGEETLEELQDLFHEMFQADIEAFASDSHAMAPNGCSPSSSSSYISCRARSGSSNKRSASEITKIKAEGSAGFDAHFENFCFGTDGAAGRSQDRKGGRRRNCRSNQRQ